MPRSRFNLVPIQCQLSFSQPLEIKSDTSIILMDCWSTYGLSQSKTVDFPGQTSVSVMFFHCNVNLYAYLSTDSILSMTIWNCKWSFWGELLTWTRLFIWDASPLYQHWIGGFKRYCCGCFHWNISFKHLQMSYEFVLVIVYF